eukprot:COSAG02_NODE_7129_length_3168_cov_1.659172_3_plen_71_part_00
MCVQESNAHFVYPHTPCAQCRSVQSGTTRANKSSARKSEHSLYVLCNLGKEWPYCHVSHHTPGVTLHCVS